MGRVGTSWEPKKLHNLDIKKNVLGRKKEERKKKNIGYRVASNERQLKICRSFYQLPYFYKNLCLDLDNDLIVVTWYFHSL